MSSRWIDDDRYCIDTCATGDHDRCPSDSECSSAQCAPEADACFDSLLNELNGLAHIAYKAKRMAKYSSNNFGWASNNFSNYALSNGQSNWNYGSNTASWCSNNFSNYALSNGQSNWNYGSNTASWCSNNFSNYALSNGQSNWNYGSNTASWCSNALFNLPSVLHTYDSIAPMPVGNVDNLGKFVEIIKGADAGNIYYVDMKGVAKLVYSPFSSNVSTWCSNSFSNFAASNAQSNWNFASNVAMWLSNNLPTWSNVTSDPMATNNPTSMYGTFTYNTSNSNIYFIDYTGKGVKIEGVYASNTASYASNAATYGSNLALWLSNNLANWSNVTTDPLATNNPASMYGSFTYNTANSNIYYVDYTGRAVPLANAYASNTSSFASNTAVYASNTATYASNTSTYASNTSTYASNTANYASNTSTYASNTSQYASNASTYASNTAFFSSNTAMWLSNNLPNWGNVTTNPLATGNPSPLYGTFTYNTGDGDIYYVDYTGRAIKIEDGFASNTSVNASNLAAWLSNNLPIWSNVSVDPAATNNSQNTYGTFTYNTANKNIFYIDYAGRAVQIEGPYASNTSAYSSNMSTWLSNNLPIWSNVTSDPNPTNNPITNYGTFTYNTVNSNIFFIDCTGTAKRIESPYASNTAAFGSNLALWLSNNLPVWSNVTSNPGPINPTGSYGTFTYNSLTAEVYFIDSVGRSGKIEGPYASNTATWLSNNLPIWSNTTTTPTATGNPTTSYGTFAYNTVTGDTYFVDYTGKAGKIESSYASNTAAWLSNNMPLWGNYTTNPAATNNPVNTYGTFWVNTATGDTYFIDYTGKSGKIETTYASNTAAWLSNNFSQKDWDWASNTADFLLKNQPEPYVERDYWLYPVGKNYTYTQCNVGIGVTTPNQALDVLGNAKLSGVVYVDIANGGAVYLYGSGNRAGTGIPTHGIGTDTTKITGVSGDEVWLYDSGGVILKTIAASNSSFAYPDAAANQGSTPPNYNGVEVLNTDCPTVWVSCNMRIPGNCAANTVNAWSICGNISLISTSCNNKIYCSNATFGGVYCDNYMTTNGVSFTSDRRLKQDIIDADLDICYSNVQNLPLRYYKWKDQVAEGSTKDRHRLGWIAQEVEAVFPKSVTTMHQHGLEDCKGMNQDQIITALYGTVQKLQHVQEDLQREVADLKIRESQRDQHVAELKALVTGLINTRALEALPKA